ncbi:MAG TPA: hypothetical protein P5287_01735 [bacterium]|nr:hypothetical protein [bacterium]
MKKLVAVIVSVLVVAGMIGTACAGGYEKKAVKRKMPVTKAPVEQPAAEEQQSGSVVYDEKDMNKNLGGAGETTVNAGKTTGDAFTGFMKETGTVVEGMGKTTGDVTVGAAKTAGECVKGFFDSAGRMLFGAGESSVKVADNSGKIVAGEEGK